MKTPVPSPLILRLPFAALFIFMTAGLFAQETNTCAEKLKTAQSYFQKGQVELIPSLLKDCLKSGFKKEEELTAYKLLIQTYLLNDKLAQADSTMLEFLRKNPEYVLSPTDHSSFVYLYGNFQVKPVVQIGIHAGTNIPFLTFVAPNPTFGEPVKSKFSSNIINLYISVESKFKITEKLEVGLEAGFSQLKFANKTTAGFTVISYNESQQRIEVPVSASYAFTSFGKFTVYGRMGVGAALTMGVTGTASYTPIDYNNKINSRTGENLSRKDSRVSIDYFGQAGTGIKYKISKGFLFAELRSNFGFLEQNVPGGATVSTMEGYYLAGEPNFRLNAVNINIGYSHIFYKPTKRKE
jgi:hypothetical protein